MYSRAVRNRDPRWIITGIVAGASLGLSVYAATRQPEPVYIDLQVPSEWNGHQVREDALYPDNVYVQVNRLNP